MFTNNKDTMKKPFDTSSVINMIGGYLFFHERISKLKQLAVLFATVGALYYVFSGDSFPWLGFLVGFTFSAYGIARKAMSSSAVPGLFIEIRRI